MKIFLLLFVLLTIQEPIYDVIIVGAGISGITCANKLYQKKNVLVLEARNRLFGRVWSNRDFGFALDLGASWIHGIKDNPLTKLAQEQNITFRRTNFESSLTIQINNGSIVPNSLAFFEYTRFLLSKSNINTIARRLQNDLPLSELFERERRSYNLNNLQTRLWYQHIRQSIEINAATDYEKLSAKYYDIEQEFDGDHVVFPNGYDEIFKGITTGLNIKLNTIVKQVNCNSDLKLVNLETSNGNFKAKKVVITVPIGVLKQKSIKFHPELPISKLNSISKLQMGHLNKLVLIFDQASWIHSYDFYFPLPIDYSQNFRLIMNWKRFTNHSALIFLITGSFSKILEDKEDQQVVDEAMKVLRYIIPRISNPIAFKFTRWTKDPFSYGSYVSIPPGAHPNDLIEVSKQVDDYLYFAGEATDNKYLSSVHAAYFSGIREAEKILKSK